MFKNFSWLINLTFLRTKNKYNKLQYVTQCMTVKLHSISLNIFIINDGTQWT